MTRRKGVQYDPNLCPRCGALTIRKSGFKFCERCNEPVHVTETHAKPSNRDVLNQEYETEIAPSRARKTLRGKP